MHAAYPLTPQLFKPAPKVGLGALGWAVAVSAGLHTVFVGGAHFGGLLQPPEAIVQNSALNLSAVLLEQSPRNSPEATKTNPSTPSVRSPQKISPVTISPVPQPKPVDPEPPAEQASGDAKTASDSASQLSPSATSVEPQGAVSAPTSPPAVVLATPADVSNPATDSLTNLIAPKLQSINPVDIPAAAVTAAKNEASALASSELKPLELKPSEFKPAESKSTSPVLNFKLPSKVRLSYEGRYLGLTAKTVVNWQQKMVDTAVNYETDLRISWLFVSYTQRSRGHVTVAGIKPLGSEEKSTKNAVTAIHFEPQNERVIISTQAGFQPYIAGGQDILGLMFQLAALVQSQPAWATAGTAQDFTVYLRSGVKQWRFLSHGIETLDIDGKPVQTIHVSRVPISAQPEFEDQQHFWLDPARYALPVKIKYVDARKDSKEVLLTSWEEG